MSEMGCLAAVTNICARGLSYLQYTPHQRNLTSLHAHVQAG